MTQSRYISRPNNIYMDSVILKQQTEKLELQLQPEITTRRNYYIVEAKVNRGRKH